MLLPQDHHHQHHSVAFKPGFGPYHVTDKDPSIRACIRHFGPSEYTVWGVTALVPSFLGYRASSTEYEFRLASYCFAGSFRSFYFGFGMMAGVGCGFVYAYTRAYCTKFTMNSTNF